MGMKRFPVLYLSGQHLLGRIFALMVLTFHFWPDNLRVCVILQDAFLELNHWRGNGGKMKSFNWMPSTSSNPFPVLWGTRRASESKSGQEHKPLSNALVIPQITPYCCLRTSKEKVSGFGELMIFGAVGWNGRGPGLSEMVAFSLGFLYLFWPAF